MNVALASELLTNLARVLSDDDCEITTDDLLEDISGRSISDQDAHEIELYLCLNG